MIATSDLINSLADRLTPVQRLRPPAIRCACWILLAAIMLSMLAITHGVRPDLGEKAQDPIFVVGLVASLLTGILAALAAFVVSLPDRSRYWLALPTPALVLWVSTIGYGCLTNWVSIEPGRNILDEAANCLATLVLTSVPLSLALLVMLRYAASLRPTATVLSGSLAVSALTASGLSIFHSLDTTIMILMWNLGVATLVVALGRMFARRMLSWVAPAVSGIDA